MKKYQYRTIESTKAYHGDFISIIKNQVIFPNNKEGIYEVFLKSDFVLIIPETKEGFLLVEQYRYPTGKNSLEFPQGGIKDGESSEQCAKRELEEETDFTSPNLIFIGEHYPCQSLSTMKCNIFYTNDLMPSISQKDDSETGMRTHTFTLKEVIQKIQSNEIIDAPTIAAMSLYLLKNNLVSIG